MTFTEYLHEKKYSPKTIHTYTNYIQRFLSWLTDENINEEMFTYTDLVDFMRHCQAGGVTKRTVGNLLGIIRHWGDYLIREGKRTDNPAAGVFIKGLVRKLPVNLLTLEEMEELHQQYCLQLSVDLSKKIMLGLMIYQGLTVSELMRIAIKDIKLGEGKIKISGTKRTGERILVLNAAQVVALQQYLQKNKWKEGALFKEARKMPVSELNIQNRIQYMFGQLKQLNPKITNANQIRSSVITHWLRQNNLRQVQYLAGHKHVSSTQRYQTTNLDELKNELAHHHPMK